jgi:hypothetical protein
MSTQVKAGPFTVTVKTPDGETIVVHGAVERPLDSVFNQVKGELNLAIPANATVLFVFNGTEYGLDRRLSDIPGIVSGSELTLVYRQRSG